MKRPEQEKSTQDPSPTATASDEDGQAKKIESLFQLVQRMDLNDKVRLATRGGKEVRMLLIRDSSRTVQLAVVQNPRITESEVASIAHSRNVDEEVLREIAGNREWLKVYQIRLALAKNPKTPLPMAIKLVPTLMYRDLKLISKSKSVPMAVAQTAVRLVVKKD